jgi:glycosyltransferase involved in cell wall biosynthesis
MSSSPLSADALQVVLVMPCLNEADNLKQTCESLGFGEDTEQQRPPATLVVVDNGSDDSTDEVAAEIRRSSQPNTVHVVQERERGFVPARHSGNLFALQLAKSSGWLSENVLILQVDADCQYSTNYIAEMRQSMETYEPNTMIEACLDHSEDFKALYSEYVRICDDTDTEFDKLFPRTLSNDIVVVDAVSGYRLSDYLNWGWHRREFNTQGEEIYAETTRLFMKARTHGAQRFRVESARALHSPRKALSEPSLHLATAGFPREDSWSRRWQEIYRGPQTIEDICTESNHPELLKAVRMREEHLLALFGILPLHVNQTLGQCSDLGSDTHELSTKILPLLPTRTANELASSPGLLISDVLELISQHGIELLNEGRKLIS